MKTIPVYARGRRVVAEVKVDDSDYEQLATRSWSLVEGYASTKIDGRRQFMHRRILGLRPGDGIACDHINRDRLDNRRDNLRLATPAENAQNRRHRGGRDSQFRNVSRTPSGKRWVVVIAKARRNYYVGSFDTEVEAAHAASAWRAEHFPFSDDARAEVKPS